ncbi:MAG TPA: YdcF family protein [Mycobacteriales bacterium]|nr:YdcF family protein [Mycobacteriales bacterium]
MTPLAWFRWARRIVLALVLLVIAYVGYVWVHIWWVAREDQHPHSDAIVVLGASQYNGRPSPVFAARLDHALALYDEGVADYIVTVGGKEPGDVYTEAGSGVTYLHQHGVPKHALVALQTGRDTLSSMRAVKGTFTSHHWHSAVLVTDPWHCLRARTMARDLGIKADTSPERGGPAADGKGVEFRYIARETEAYIYYEIFHDDNEHSAGVI